MSSAIVYRHDEPVGRLPILDVKPSVDNGRWQAKAFVGELIPFSATVFREGHDSLGVELLLTSPTGKNTIIRMRAGAPGSDRWHAEKVLDEQGVWRLRIRAFADDFDSWHHNTEVKLAAGVDEELMMLEGIALLTRAASEKDRTKANAKGLVDAAETLSNQALTPKQRFESACSPSLLKNIAAQPIRTLETLSEEFSVNCERTLAGRGSWYEFFPRSEGAKYDAKTKTWTSGTFKTATKRLSAVASMGFDVLYMPPIHPIGVAFRKGPNNTLTAAGQDPGSPWAIGSSAALPSTQRGDCTSSTSHLRTVQGSLRWGACASLRPS
jgi:starch synthase (maltosyl-transferring)